jgi:hypothetical protein
MMVVWESLLGDLYFSDVQDVVERQFLSVECWWQSFLEPERIPNMEHIMQMHMMFLIN